MMGVSNQTKSVRSAVLACLVALIPPMVQAEQPMPRAMVGAYYFDGWSGKTEDIHLPRLLQTKYADRKPVWGWRDDTVEIMEKQIDYCADHGIAFWSFCWYYPEGENKTTPLNNALDLNRKSPNCERLKFCLLVANHGGFRIGPKDWDACCEKWIDLFRAIDASSAGGGGRGERGEGERGETSGCCCSMPGTRMAKEDI